MRGDMKQNCKKNILIYILGISSYTSSIGVKPKNHVEYMSNLHHFITNLMIILR